MAHTVTGMDVEAAELEGRPDTSVVDIVGANRQEVDDHSNDMAYTLEETAYWAVQLNKGDLVAVWEEVAWAAAHGALRADDGSSCP